MSLEKCRRVPLGRSFATAGITLTLAVSMLPAQQAIAADSAEAHQHALFSAAGSEEKIEQIEQLVSQVVAQVEENAKTTGEKAVEKAKEYRGTPYVAAGSGPSGFDCSGFTKYVYGKLGVKLTHNSQAQYNECGKKVAKKNLQPGDLVFFGGSTSSINHVGIYVGNGKYIHSPQTGDVVSIDDLSRRSNYVGAARPY